MKLFNFKRKQKQPRIKFRGKFFYLEGVTEDRVKIKIVDQLMKDETILTFTHEQLREINDIICRRNKTSKLLTILSGIHGINKRSGETRYSLADSINRESDNCELRIICEAYNRIITVIPHDDERYYDSIAFSIEEYSNYLRRGLRKLIREFK